MVQLLVSKKHSDMVKTYSISSWASGDQFGPFCDHFEVLDKY